MEDFDLEEVNKANEMVPQKKAAPQEQIAEPAVRKVTHLQEDVPNCLRNVRVIVRHLPKNNGVITDPKHVLYGGMSEVATKTFTVPLMRNGRFCNVLTNDEKQFLEQFMGLDPDALSVYNTRNNYWENFQVPLKKDDNYFDLSDPTDYIKYKVLLANKDFIAPSLEAYQNMPKVTYQFVIVQEGEEDEQASKKTNATMSCYKEYGKIENNYDVLKLIVETLDGRPMAKNQKITFLQNKAVELITADPKLFLKTIKDPYIEHKVIIKKAVENGVLSFKGGGYYLRENNMPLCEDREDPTLSNAAKYIASAKHQELLLMLQAKTS